MGCPSKVCFAPGLRLERTSVVSAKMVDQAVVGEGITVTIQLFSMGQERHRDG